MRPGQFSSTAIRTAALRAAHQTVDSGRIFPDTLAARVLLDDDAEALNWAAGPAVRRLRLFVALRSRIAEEASLAAVGRGARQIVALGAGLDTFAYRAPVVAGLRIFEVDHPATQAEKRRRLALDDLPAPAHLTYAPCNFEDGTLADALAAAGFDAAAYTAFLWLGVVPYLTTDAVEATLRFIAARPAEVVFDYANPLTHGEDRVFETQMRVRVAGLGEPFRCYFETTDLHRLLSEIGFEGQEDIGPSRIVERLGGPPRAHDRGGHILHAWRR